MSIRICDECGYVYDEAASILRPHGQRVYDSPECNIGSFVPLCPGCGSPDYASIPDRIAERRPRRPREGASLPRR